jgi:flagellar secretion chaperone FliS
MSYGVSSNRYREMEINSMSPAKRVVLMYSHLVASLQQARGFIVANDIVGREGRLAKAEGIVMELAVSLDREQGGVLAAELSAIYAWMLSEMAKVHRKPDLKRLDGLIELARELHGAWDAAAQQIGTDAAQAVA